MDYKINDIDTAALKLPVLSFEFEINNFIDIMNEIRKDYERAYVSTKVEMERFQDIDYLLKYGFSYAECQLKTHVKFRNYYDVSKYNYTYSKVETDNELQQILDIVQGSINHDRFTIDPCVGKFISGERYKKYILKSFVSDDEEIWCLKEPLSGEVHAFRSHKIINKSKALLLLGAVRSDLQNFGVGVISAYYFMNQMKNSGFKTAETFVSAINYPIINLEVGAFGFKVLQAYAVMRKIIEKQN